MDLLVFRCVQFDKVLKFSGIASDGTPLVMLHVRVDTAIAENKARGGQGCIVGTYFTAQWTYCLELW